jgi:polysaccharide biosynthesis protein PelA
MRLFNLFVFLSMFCTSSYAKTKFLVCYSKFDITKVTGYDLVIVESAHFNAAEVKYLKKYNKKVIAYISLGEVNENAKDFKKLKNNVSDRNQDWNSYYIDIASEKVQKVVKSRIKNIFYLGYDGLFLDNIDNYTKFGFQFHLQQNLIEFVTAIRTEYPQKVFVQNAGLDLLGQLHTKIDYVLVESVFSDYNFTNKKYQLRDTSSKNLRLSLLKESVQKYQIKPLVLEYAIDYKMVNTLRKLVKKENWPYSISEITLQNLPITL